MKNVGVISIGVKAPIIRHGDNLTPIVYHSVLNALDELSLSFNDGDIICVTESIVARAQGNYVTVDDIAQFLRDNGYHKNINLVYPIMSRNRFSVILRGFARYCNNITIYVDTHRDEQGNPTHGINQFTGIDIQEYYSKICAEEKCNIVFRVQSGIFESDGITETFEGIKERHSEHGWTTIDARCHPDDLHKPYSLVQILNKPVKRFDEKTSGYNEEWGVLGSNKANDETLKLFPRKKDCEQLCIELQEKIKDKYDKHVEVCVYGDGCFHDPVGGIWEFADPVAAVYFTDGLKGSPNELKLKYLADNKFADLSEEELKQAIKEEIKSKDENLVGKESSEGTTPRRYQDLIPSLADLTSGSGDRGCPIIYIKNYNKNYSHD